MAALIAMAVAQFAVSALKGWQTYEEGQYEKDVAKVQAESLLRQSQEVQQTAGMKIAEQDYIAQHQLAQAKATTAAAGIEETEGSPQLMQFTSMNQQRVNDLYTKYAANVESAALDTQASVVKAEGEQAAVGAEAAATLGTISGGINAYSGYQTATQEAQLSAAAWNFYNSQGGVPLTTGAVGGSSSLGNP